MSDVEIKGKISVDTGNAGKSINELNAAIKEQSKLLKDAKVGSEDYKAAQAALSKAQDELKKTTDAANETHGKSGEAFGILKEKINGLVPGLEGAQSGVKSLGAELKVLLVNPIILFLTAIVAVLALVYKAFTNTFEGGEKMEQIFAGIKAAAQALIDNLQKLGKVAMDFLTLHWGDAAKGLKDIGAAAGEAYNAMADLTEQAQELHREQLKMSLEDAKRAGKLAELREKLADSETSPAEKKKIAKALLDDELTNGAKSIENQKKITENKIKQLTIQKDGAKKNQDEISQLNIEDEHRQTQHEGELRRIRKAGTTADKQADAERKAAEKEQEAANKKALDKAKANMDELLKLQDATFKHSISKQDLAILLLEEKYKKEQALLKKNHADTLLLESNFRRDLTMVIASSLKKDEVVITRAVGMRIVADNTVRDSALKKDWDIAAADGIKASIDKELLKLKMEAIATEVEGYGAAAGMISSILGKQTAVGKGLAVASASISTFEAITKQLSAFSKVPVPGYAIAQAIATGLVGLANVKKILSVQVPGAAGGGGSVPSLPSIVAAPLAPTATSTSLNQASINAVGNAAQGGVNRTFVLDSDIKNNHERANRINRAARLG